MTTKEISQNATAIWASTKNTSREKIYRSARTGRLYSVNERIAAARARVTADKKRGVTTEQWIVDLAKQGQQR